MDLYLIRHTTVAVGRSICYGQSDVDLLETYEDEKNRIRSLLPDNLHDLTVWASPLGRCRRLAEDLHPQPRFDDRLKEFHFGDWEMQPWNAIPADSLNAWMADFVNVRTPNGEHFQAFFERVTAFWQEQIQPLLTEQTAAPVALVTHGGVIRCLLCLFLDLSLRNAYRLHLDYGSVSRVAVYPTHQTIQYINR